MDLKITSLLLLREVSIITDHKLLVVFKKRHSNAITEITILLRLHQYRVRIIYNPGPHLFIADWLSRQNHKENKDAQIPGMQLNMMPCKQQIIYQAAWQYISYNRQCHKMNTYSVWKIISLKASQKTEIKYHETWEHTGHFEMIWQWFSKRKVYNNSRITTNTGLGTLQC